MWFWRQRHLRKLRKLYRLCQISVCGKIITEQMVIPINDHQYGSGVITRQATCTATGVKTFTCMVCGKSRTEDIPATGHKTVTDPAVAPTCTKAGLTAGNHCSVCGIVLVRQTEVPATGHRFGRWITTAKATVFASAKQTRTCSGCGKKEIRNYGSKLKPTVKVNVSSIPLKVKQSTSKIKVTGLANGDSVKSWKSSNTKIVKISGKSNGSCKLTAQKKTGNATVTVTLASGKTAKIKVKVQKGTVRE